VQGKAFAGVAGFVAGDAGVNTLIIQNCVWYPQIPTSELPWIMIRATKVQLLSIWKGQSYVIARNKVAFVFSGIDPIKDFLVAYKNGWNAGRLPLCRSTDATSTKPSIEDIHVCHNEPFNQVIAGEGTPNAEQRNNVGVRTWVVTSDGELFLSLIVGGSKCHKLKKPHLNTRLGRQNACPNDHTI